MKILITAHISYFLTADIKYADKTNLREKKFILVLVPDSGEDMAAGREGIMAGARGWMVT